MAYITGSETFINNNSSSPAYSFEIERDHSGLLKGIRAVPEGGA